MDALSFRKGISILPSKKKKSFIFVIKQGSDLGTV